MNYTIIIYVFIFIVGTIFGSFYNVVGYRRPKNESIVFPASHCPNCNHKLKYYENIPILSYLFLKGKCKNCKSKISILYPLFEIITGISFVLSYLVFGFSIEFISAIVISSTLIIISISDIRYYIIPDEVLIVGSLLLIIINVANAVINKLSFNFFILCK